MNTNNTTSSSAVANLIASKTATVEKAAVETTDRFMLVLKTQTRDNLRTLCEKLGVKQISFASELFEVALGDAMAAVYAAENPKTETPKGK